MSSCYLYTMYDTIHINNGCVGIGTTKPSSLLHIEGSTYLNSITNRSKNIDFTNCTLSNINNINAKNIYTEGNVGIGTNSTRYSLDVNGITCFSNMKIQKMGNMCLYNFIYGDILLTSGNKYIGFNISWSNISVNDQLAFRVNMKCQLSSNTDISYRVIDIFITPSSVSPNPGMVRYNEITNLSSTDFNTFSQSVTRISATSVEVKMTWTAIVATYKASIQTEILSPSLLGDFVITPISG